MKRRTARNRLEAKIPQAEVAQLYDSLSRIYDAWGLLTESRARRRVLELASVRDGESVLEVAAGTGLAFIDVVRSNPLGRNVAIDLSQGMLAKAARRLKRGGLSRYQLRLGSALAIDEADAGFDLVLNNYMFDLLDEGDWPLALGEFHRVLKPGGRLVMANMTRPERLGAGIYEWLYQRSPRLMGGCRGVELSEPLAHQGFSVVSRTYIQQCLFPSEVIVALKPF